MDTALLGVVYVILGSMDGQMDVLSEDVSRCRISNYIVSLNEKFGSKVLEENHLDQAIEQELEGAPWLSPFLPSSPEAMSYFILRAGLTQDDVVLDIGCGDGRVLVTAAKMLGCRGIGIDVSKACVESARAMTGTEEVSHLVSVHCADATHPGSFEELELSEATVVFLYVYPTLLNRLEPLLTRLRKGGARVFTVQYHLSGEIWEPSATWNDDPSTRLYPPLPSP